LLIPPVISFLCTVLLITTFVLSFCELIATFVIHKIKFTANYNALGRKYKSIIKLTGFYRGPKINENIPIHFLFHIFLQLFQLQSSVLTIKSKSRIVAFSLRKKTIFGSLTFLKGSFRLAIVSNSSLIHIILTNWLKEKMSTS
jgi:hypothetical protein